MYRYAQRPLPHSFPTRRSSDLPRAREIARLPEGFRLLWEPPRSPEYLRLRRISGLSPRTPEQATGALMASWAWAIVRDRDGDLAAMGRVIGDGTWYFHLRSEERRVGKECSARGA